MTVAGRPTGERTVPADHVVSSMPISALVRAMDPPAPAEVLAAADDLRYRDFLTVALVVPESAGFPDNWIYIHTPGVRVGRIQNFGSWSPYLVKDGRTCLGLEYFVSEGDDLWDGPDDDLIEHGDAGAGGRSAWSTATAVEEGYVVRMPKAYPVYDEDYRGNVDVIREWLARERAERAPGRPQRHAPLQQPGPLDDDGDAHRREHRRRHHPRRVVGERRGGVPRGGLGRRSRPAPRAPAATRRSCRAAGSRLRRRLAAPATDQKV